MRLTVHTSLFPLLPLLAGGLSLLAAACASNKGLPSDRPFDASQYNPNPQANASGNTSSEGLVSTPTPLAAATATPATGVPFKFTTTCTDPLTNQSFAATDAGFDACVRKKQESQPTPKP